MPGLLDESSDDRPRKKRGLLDFFAQSESDSGESGPRDPSAHSGASGGNRGPAADPKPWSLSQSDKGGSAVVDPTRGTKAGGFLGKGWNDPRTSANLQLAAALMNKGSFGKNLGRGLAAREQSLGEASDREMRGQVQTQQLQMGNLQMDTAQRTAQQQQAMQALRQRFMRPDGTFDFGGYSQAMAQFDPQGSLSMQASLKKDTTPVISKPGDIARAPTGEIVWQNPAAAEKDDELVARMKLAGIDPASPQGQAIARQALTKQTTHAPPASMHVGLTTPVMVQDPTTGQMIMVQPANKPGAASQILTDPRTGKPFGAVGAESKPPTEFEAKAGLYFKSMEAASTVLNDLEAKGQAAVPALEAAAPDGVRNIVRKVPRQSYVQAQRQWVDSINRVRSGANLPELEYERAVKTFFPEFGDDKGGPQVIEQKRRMRAEEERNMRTAAGRAMPSPASAPKRVKFGDLN